MKFKVAKCDVTGEKVLLSDGYYVCNTTTGNWFFASVDAPERAFEYSIAVTRLTKSPEALVDWIAHLEEKSWFNANKFISFFSKLRADNDLYSSL